MKLHYIDFWKIEATYKCVPSNGFIKKNGENVMGAGVAKMIRDRYRNAARLMGMAIEENGNIVQPFMDADNMRFLAFPTKNVWWEKSNITIIAKSAKELINYIDEEQIEESVVLPKPGCGNGQLSWHDVEPVLDELFKDHPQIIIIDKP